MIALEFQHRTFSKTVKKEIATKLDKIKSFKSMNRKEVGLRNSEGKTIAFWQQTPNGSRVFLTSSY